MLTVNTQTFRVTQDSIGCNSTLDYGSLDVADEGGQLSIAVNTMAGCVWTVAISEGWVTTTTPNGTGSGFVNLQILRNTGDTRRAFVTIAGGTDYRDTAARLTVEPVVHVTFFDTAQWYTSYRLESACLEPR